MSNYKIAVLGDKDSVLGFKALGLDVFPAESAEEAKRTLHALAKENYAVVYLTEGYAAHMEAELERYKDALTPAIIRSPARTAPWASVWPTSSGPWSVPWARIFCSSPYAHNALGAL